MRAFRTGVYHMPSNVTRVTASFVNFCRIILVASVTAQRGRYS